MIDYTKQKKGIRDGSHVCLKEKRDESHFCLRKTSGGLYFTKKIFIYFYKGLKVPIVA